MHTMTETEWRAFATDGTRTGKLAVQRKDGAPHVTPVWFTLDESDPGAPYGVTVVFTTGVDSLKARALRRDPRFALCVDDQEPPYSFLLLECSAELTEDPDQLLEWATRLGTRYMGPEKGLEFGRRNAAPGECVVRGRIDRIVAHADVAA
jgi:PPOX class probable F420-dependent enzyme